MLRGWRKGVAKLHPCRNNPVLSSGVAVAVRFSNYTNRDEGAGRTIPQPTLKWENEFGVEFAKMKLIAFDSLLRYNDLMWL